MVRQRLATMTCAAVLLALHCLSSCKDPQPLAIPTSSGGSSGGPPSEDSSTLGGSAPTASFGEEPSSGGNPSMLAASGSAEPDAAVAPRNQSGEAASSRLLIVDGQPYVMLGVCWNPVPAGAVHPEGLDYAGFAAQDIALMAQMGVNTVRTYEPLLDRQVLDQLFAAGIRVINSVYSWGGDDPSVVTARVAAVKDHPAIVMWSLGNEWNYNGLYVDLPHAQSLARLNEVAALVRAEDPDHPIATIYGELPSADTLDAMPGIDVWGINSYRGLSFGNLFDDWRALSEAPMFLAEFGADAYNSTEGRYDPDSHALAVGALSEEILDHASALHPQGVAIGGTLFEWADEWWKDSTGSASEQDVGGIAPGGGPYPDATFNEEWWGLVDIDRAPRPAYERLQQIFQSALPTP